MEATGVYWKPVWHILEGQFELLLANPTQVQALRGRKTDLKDGERIADFLQHGLLQGSFVPPQPIQQLRDLTRSRTTLKQEQVRIGNRIRKVLEDANLKLSSVMSDVMGVSGREMLRAIVGGESDPAALAKRADTTGQCLAATRAHSGRLGGEHEKGLILQSVLPPAGSPERKETSDCRSSPRAVNYRLHIAVDWEKYTDLGEDYFDRLNRD